MEKNAKIRLCFSWIQTICTPWKIFGKIGQKWAGFFSWLHAIKIPSIFSWNYYWIFMEWLKFSENFEYNGDHVDSIKIPWAHCQSGSTSAALSCNHTFVGINYQKYLKSCFFPKTGQITFIKDGILKFLKNPNLMMFCSQALKAIMHSKKVP